jgi:PAS domain S-box-containing protein
MRNARGPAAPGRSLAGSAGEAFIDRLEGDAFGYEALSLAEQAAGIGVWSIDLATGMVRATPQFFRTMGLEPTSDRVPIAAIRALRHPDDRDRVVDGFRHALEGGIDSYEIEYRIIRPDGQVRWIFGRGRVVRGADGKPERYNGIDLDITERKAAEAALAAAKVELERMNQVLEERVRERTRALEAEAKLRAETEVRLHQAQKMEAVGQLTGGIAHDFNNILQVIMGNLEIARYVLQAPEHRDGASGPLERAVKAIETAQRASRSAGQLVQRMLVFSRMQRLEPATLDVNALITDMQDMISRTLGETIEVKARLAPDLWPIFADRNQLESALLNLVVNARDAMQGGGLLTIETANVELADGSGDDAAPGQYAMINVSDTGCGIPAELMDKVFEPFFTTKEVGTGSGLGLSMVYGFVKQSRGHVRLHSEVGAGTSVRIHLPRSIAGEANEGATASGQSDSAPAESSRAREGETVLLVEDNEQVRALGVSALENLGYRVLEASDGHSALRLLDGGASRVDLLFSDVVLPGGMSGPELAAASSARRPGLAVLFTSGYTGNAGKTDDPLRSDAPMLRKPYARDALARAVRRAIDEARSPSST